MSREPFFSSLVMVGTVHRDPKGFGKLLRILEREAPDFITVEISPYALEFREKQASHFRAILRENLTENPAGRRRIIPPLLVSWGNPGDLSSPEGSF